jgi:hypothetical protein
MLLLLVPVARVALLPLLVITVKELTEAYLFLALLLLLAVVVVEVLMVIMLEKMVALVVAVVVAVLVALAGQETRQAQVHRKEIMAALVLAQAPLLVVVEAVAQVL